MSEMAQRIKDLRGELGLSQAALAQRAGIPLQTLKGYEGGNRIPGGEALAGFAKAGGNINWLLIGAGPILLKDVSRGGGSANSELLTTIIDAIEQVLDDNDLEMAPGKKAEVIVGVYELLQDSDAKVSPATILRLVKSAA